MICIGKKKKTYNLWHFNFWMFNSTGFITFVNIKDNSLGEPLAGLFLAMYVMQSERGHDVFGDNLK